MAEETSSLESFLAGVRVLELADELGEYAGKVLAGLGADVIKIEPVGGEKTRSYGPFYRDEPHLDRSLYFWHYNFGKRSVVLDLDSDAGVEQLKRLAAGADVIIDTRHRDYLESRGVGYETLRKLNSGLVYARISPFGDDGPWADYQSCDLVHLALGGVMMNCGYDAEPSGFYDMPPMAPQMWHAYHIAGEITVIEIIAALNYRARSGIGQKLSTSVHWCVSQSTETDLPDWIYSRQPHRRQTCRHSFPQVKSAPGEAASAGSQLPNIAMTKDGRWILPYRTYLPGFVTSFDATLKVLTDHGMEQDLTDKKYEDLEYLRRTNVNLHVGAVVDRLIGKYSFNRDLWKEGQNVGLPWAPLRRPEENLSDPHWAARETFFHVEYPELVRSFLQSGAKWMAYGIPWRRGPRAPLLGEHNSTLLNQASRSPLKAARRPDNGQTLSAHGKPFALSGVRIIDLSWLLASAGSGRFFTSLGAEVIKVEHASKVDGMRMGIGVVGPGGRAARDAATEPLEASTSGSLDRSGAFMEINAGKRSLRLNLKHPRGKELLSRLLQDADMIIEGFSPGTMERMGFGYERLRQINPRLIYVQQSGMGQAGTHGRMRSFGPTAQAFSGLSEMSGMPTPFPPAGIGYSFLDWFGAYQMAAAMMAALYRAQRTGQGCWIDSSQVEVGLYLTGTAILDYSVNGRNWQRYGNRSPYKPAAPHGAYRASGDDSWIAIAAFTEAQWLALVNVLGTRVWLDDRRLASLADRLANQDYLDNLMNGVTRTRDAFELMETLQRAKVPAGVCQTAEDRCERDPQLRHLRWLVELDQTEIGRWPVREIPVSMDETPPYIGGMLNRHGPNYGEDTHYVLTQLLGLKPGEIAELEADGVL